MKIENLRLTPEEARGAGLLANAQLAKIQRKVDETGKPILFVPRGWIPQGYHIAFLPNTSLHVETITDQVEVVENE